MVNVFVKWAVPLTTRLLRLPLDPTFPPKRNYFAAVSTTTAKKHFRQNDEDDLKVFTAERRQTDKHSEGKKLKRSFTVNDGIRKHTSNPF